jgi:hypothetical protein
VVKKETEDEVETGREPDRANDETDRAPRLSSDFFRELLKPPKCKVTGECDDCGRCSY